MISLDFNCQTIASCEKNSQEFAEAMSNNRRNLTQKQMLHVSFLQKIFFKKLSRTAEQWKRKGMKKK
jgi:hypothetical protein